MAQRCFSKPFALWDTRPPRLDRGWYLRLQVGIEGSSNLTLYFHMAQRCFSKPFALWLCGTLDFHIWIGVGI